MLAQRRSSCRSVSQWCMRCGDHCSVPAHASASLNSGVSAYHANAHTAEATAEMLRPYPLGTQPPPSSEVPDVEGCSLDETLAKLNKEFWNAHRFEVTESKPLAYEGSFLQRFAQQHEAVRNKRLTSEIRLGDPTGVRDLCVAFYYRFLQTRIMPHVCKLGLSSIVGPRV